MAVRATAKRDLGQRFECRVIGIRSAFDPRTNTFAPGDSPLWTVVGPLGKRRISPRALDLLDLAGAIYRLESGIPLRPTNPAKEWQVSAPVRDVAFWSGVGGKLLAAVLSFLNRAQWSFTFERRQKLAEIAITSEPRDIREVLLFSGGMDSACGAGMHPEPREGVHLVSFYTNQKTLQQRLAADLGYHPPVQWRLTGRRGKEGMDLIRAFLFLTLGAITARTHNASRIFQYENGLLAMAIPPAGAQVPTRHAHPEFHRRMERLLEAVFERKLEIQNPFALLTKREEAAQFAKSIGNSAAEAILRQTQTCWRHTQAWRVGKRKKRPYVPCGVCTPCIVRRTARPFEAEKDAWDGWPGYAFDLRNPAIQRGKLGTTFRAYLELITIVLHSTGDHEMIADLAPEARALIGGSAGPTEQQAADLLRRFAGEFCEAFKISVPEKQA